MMVRQHIRAMIFPGALVLVFVFAKAPAARAHEPARPATEGRTFTIELMPREAIQGDELPLEVHVARDGNSAPGLRVMLTADRHEAGVSDRLETAEREPGHYMAMYRFAEAGAYEIHIEIEADGRTERATAYVNVLPTSIFSLGLLFGGGGAILGVIFLVGGILTRRPKRGAIGALLALVAAGLGYSLSLTLKSGAQSRGVVTCISDTQCFWTAHIHAFIPIELCGERFALPIETGSLQGPHTHEERNIVHWHDRLPYDRTAKTLPETRPLTLGAFFDELEIPFGDRNIAGKTNGDRCNDTTATLKMFVNGTANTDYRNYVWKNKDVIFLAFDSRSAQTIEEELRVRPLTFPILGRE